MHRLLTMEERKKCLNIFSIIVWDDDATIKILLLRWLE